MTAHIAPTRRHLDAPEWVHLVLVISTLATLWCAGYIYLGDAIAAPVIVAGALALVGWRAVTYGTVPSPTLFPVYILALVALQVNVLEKWMGGYAAMLLSVFPDAFVAPSIVFDGSIFVAIFGPGAAALFLWASLGLFLGHPLGAYMAWALFVWSIFEGLMPVALSLASNELLYVPGMATGVLPLAAGVYGIARLFRDSRQFHAAR